MGDLVDAPDRTHGGWFEAKVVKITHKEADSESELSSSAEDAPESTSSAEDALGAAVPEDDGLLYHVQYDE